MSKSSSKRKQRYNRVMGLSDGGYGEIVKSTDTYKPSKKVDISTELMGSVDDGELLNTVNSDDAYDWSLLNIETDVVDDVPTNVVRTEINGMEYDIQEQDIVDDGLGTSSTERVLGGKGNVKIQTYLLILGLVVSVVISIFIF